MSREASSTFKNDLLLGKGHKFSPRADLQKKRNFTAHTFFSPDGSIRQAIRLNVLDDREREEIIAFHFAQQYAKINYPETPTPPHFYITKRDDPWDFEYVMHDGTTFNLEICRVADTALLRAIKLENDCRKLLHKGWLKGFEISKIEKAFPGTLPFNLTESANQRENKKKLFYIAAEFRDPRIFLRPPLNPHIDLKRAIYTAIAKKNAKRHKGKEDTILVLDNLTTLDEPDDFFAAAEEIYEFILASPFQSIWLYTGYYSDSNGYDCEFSIIPLKASDEAMNLLLSN
ncbi:hypothetical protein MACH18_10230 [Phaeobacter italicus]|uniref:hypothetical protein n=1 Tax=Phaeobacter italicus TaxID=481446 RepID=UPI0027752576|nr:hypothetical protein [Phaeobacter italicus]GLO73943.1 hypothetical protein MACH18_10230 [Phaeobacter italicus]